MNAPSYSTWKHCKTVFLKIANSKKNINLKTLVMAKYIIVKNLSKQAQAGIGEYVSQVMTAIPKGTIVEGTIDMSSKSIPLSFIYKGGKFIANFDEYKSYPPVAAYSDVITSKKYKLLQKYLAVDYKYDSYAGGTPPILKEFKSGDIIEGNLIVRTFNDGSVKKFFQPIVNNTKCVWIEEEFNKKNPIINFDDSGNISISTKSFFTPKNILISIVSVLAIFGLVKLFKPKVKK